MKLFNTIAASATALACSHIAGVPAQAFLGNSPLIGSWECKTTMRDSDGVTSLEAQITYSRNGTYFDSGTLTFTSEEISFPLEYTYYSTGKWSMRPGNILKSSSSNAHVNNVTTIPGGTHQQDLAFRAEMDRALPLHGMLQDVASQGVYSQVKFSNKNNRTESILEGERDWKNATICNRL